MMAKLSDIVDSGLDDDFLRILFKEGSVGIEKIGQRLHFYVDLNVVGGYTRRYWFVYEDDVFKEYCNHIVK